MSVFVEPFWSELSVYSAYCMQMISQASTETTCMYKIYWITFFKGPNLLCVGVRSVTVWLLSSVWPRLTPCVFHPSPAFCLRRGVWRRPQSAPVVKVNVKSRPECLRPVPDIHLQCQIPAGVPPSGS